MGSINFQAALWLFIIPLVSILLPVWLGQRLGFYLRKKSAEALDAPVGTSVAAALGLFGFMLAFTFQIVGGRLDKRKELLLEEVSNIRTAYLYSGLVPEPIRTDARKKIVNYVDVRVKLLQDPSTIKTARSESERLLDSLWKDAETLAAQDRSSEMYSLFSSSVSEIITSFAQRITVSMQFRLPKLILYVLAFVGFFSMLTLGFQFGIAGHMKAWVNVFLALCFAAVMWLVLTLDNPRSSFVSLNTKPFLDLQEQLHRNVGK